MCGVGAAELLDAAHLRAKEARETDDPRNGLVLCATHHRAFDAGLFGIEPVGYGIRVRPGGPSAEALGITRPSLRHLARRPHEEAVRWRWQRTSTISEG
ncbi:MAG TPA: HNH endonuclease signature motif containing protein [Geminicoccaceae bacterium]|nr:HNH endonuclease signature motif containing protein [Geminicoccaceae bacterium]